MQAILIAAMLVAGGFVYFVTYFRW